MMENYLSTSVAPQRVAPGHWAQTARSNHERGIVLPMALIMLVIISFAGLLAARKSASTEQFSNNMRTTQVSRQSAELALRHCERVAISFQAIADGETPDVNYSAAVLAKVSTTQIAAPTDTTAVWKAKANWKSSGANLISVTPTYGTAVAAGAKLVQNPSCVVQKMTNNRYLITARGLSSDATVDTSSGELASGSEVWLQSILVPTKPIF